MKDTPDSFDHLVRSKLDEVEVNPSLADAYWQQMQLPAIKQTGANNFRRYYWFGASVLLTMLVIFVVTKKDKKVSSNANATIIQQPNKATPINTYDTVLIMEKKQAAISPVVTKPKEIKGDNLNKSASQKTHAADNQFRNKPNYDSIANHQTTVKLKALYQVDKIDTVSKENPLSAGIQQAKVNLEKIDSLNKKPEAKKKAPHIIW